MAYDITTNQSVEYNQDFDLICIKSICTSMWHS